MSRAQITHEFEPFVQSEFLISSDDRNVFGDSLGKDLTERQPEQMQGMLGRVRQKPHLQIRGALD